MNQLEGFKGAAVALQPLPRPRLRAVGWPVTLSLSLRIRLDEWKAACTLATLSDGKYERSTDGAT